MDYDTEIFRAAELICEWDSEPGPARLRYKLFHVPRAAIDIDADCEEPDAHLLIGIDAGGVRRVDAMLDMAFDRKINADLDVPIASAPLEAADILKGYPH